MLVEATQHPIVYTMTNGAEVRLVPGTPVDLPEPQAKALLKKAPDRVRLVTPDPAPAVTIEPATGCRPVYWKSRGRIIGPGKVSHIAKDGHEFWCCLEFEGVVYWICNDLLRSKQAFVAQNTGACFSCRGPTFGLPFITSPSAGYAIHRPHLNLRKEKRMDVRVDPTNNQVVLNTDRGTEITLTWSGALLLGTLLREASGL